MRQWTVPALVQIMACRLIGAKPLPEAMLAYCNLDSWTQWKSNRISIIFIQENAFEFVVCQSDGHFVQWADELTIQVPVPFAYGVQTLSSLCLQISRHLVLIDHQYNIKVLRVWRLNTLYIDGFVQNCSIYKALAMEILRSCIMPSICSYFEWYIFS